jgi:hypothetical protein
MEDNIFYFTNDSLKQSMNNTIENNNFDERKKELLANYYYYEQGKFIDVVANVMHLDTDKLQALLTKQYYNAQITEFVQYVINSTFYTCPPEDRLRYFCSQQKYVDGYYVVNYNKSSLQFYVQEVITDKEINFLVFKKDIDEEVELLEVDKIEEVEYADNSLNELIVTLYATNKLRNICPNFIYTYGVYTSVVTVKKSSDVLIPYLLVGKRYNHMIIEDISESVAFANYLDYCTVQQFKDVVMQIAYALEIAQHKYDFTHYSLNLYKILISRKSSKEHCLVYQRDREKVRYINTVNLAQITGFENAYVKIKGIAYGVDDDEVKSRLQKNTMRDIYTLLYLLADNFYNKSCLNPGLAYLQYYIEEAFKIFNPVDSIQEILKQKNAYLYYPNEQGDISKFIDKLEEVWSIDYNKKIDSTAMLDFQDIKEICITSLQADSILSFQDNYLMAKLTRRNLANIQVSAQLITSMQKTINTNNYSLQLFVTQLNNIATIVFSDDHLINGIITDIDYLLYNTYYYLNSINSLANFNYILKASELIILYDEQGKELLEYSKKFLKSIYELLNFKIGNYLRKAFRHISERNYHYEDNDELLDIYETAYANIMTELF